MLRKGRTLDLIFFALASPRRHESNGRLGFRSTHFKKEAARRTEGPNKCASQKSDADLRPGRV